MTVFLVILFTHHIKFTDILNANNTWGTLLVIYIQKGKKKPVLRHLTEALRNQESYKAISQLGGK